jgi:hypothetical protein
LASFRTMGLTDGIAAWRPLSAAVRVGIGFVLPRSFVPPTRHNSLFIKYLPFVVLGGNWLCFARFGPAPPARATLPALAYPGPPVAIGFVSHNSQRWGAFPILPVLVHSGLDKAIGFVCTSGPSAGSTGDLARPRPFLSLRADWLRLARIGSEYRVYADRTGLSRPKAALRTVQDRLWDLLASGADLRRGCVLGRSRRNPPKSWSFVCHSLFCCPVIIYACEFLVKSNLDRIGWCPATVEEIQGILPPPGHLFDVWLWRR